MPIDTSANTAFSLTLPGLQVAWDSTSLSALKTCPRLYYYTMVEGWEPRSRSFHLTFGLLYHAALERYDHSRANGADHDASMSAAVRTAMENSWDYDLQRPWMSPDANKNRFTLVRTIVWYLDQFAEDAAETVRLANGKPAVELSFKYDFPLTFSTGEGAIYCGHLDRVAKIGGAVWILDRKTTKHAIGPDYFQQYSPDNQMSAYALAGKIIYNIPVSGVIIDAAQVMVTFSRFTRGFAHRTESQLEEWMGDTQHYLKMADSYAQAQHWPMNDKACGMYGGCAFRQICSRSPEVRSQFLAANFQRRVWDPLIQRGDI